nr:hypothetical protein [Thermoanaerobaculia bacterium]
MKNRYLLSWLILGALGLGLFLWAFPRAFPTLPQHWTLARDGAQALALEKFRDLGEPVANAYVETSFQPDYALDRRLQLEGAPPPGAPGTSDVRFLENYVHDNGNVNSQFEHNSYTESDGILFEGNRYGPLLTGSRGT